MKVIKDLVLDEERALYNLKDALIENIKFDGPADGESALKECENARDYFEEHGYLIEMKYTPRLDYIKIIEKI